MIYENSTAVHLSAHQLAHRNYSTYRRLLNEATYSLV